MTPKAREEFGEAVAPLIATHQAAREERLDPGRRLPVAGAVRGAPASDRRMAQSESAERSVTGARLPRVRGRTSERPRRPAGPSPPASSACSTSTRSRACTPTTVAIEQSRELAERVVAYAERAPTLMRWQAELLALQIQEQPAPQELLADTTSVSRSIESISKTVEGVPELVNAQREAAIAQLFAGVTSERQAILAELEAKEATIQTLLGQLRETMNAGGEMGKSLTGTIQSLDAFVHYVSPPPDPNAPPAKPGKPFDSLDFGKAAVDVGGMARDLNALLRSANETAPALAKIGAADGRRPEERRRPRLLARIDPDRRAPRGLRAGPARLSRARAPVRARARIAGLGVVKPATPLRNRPGRRFGALLPAITLVAAILACRGRGEAPAASAQPTPAPPLSRGSDVRRARGLRALPRDGGSRGGRARTTTSRCRRRPTETVLGNFDERLVHALRRHVDVLQAGREVLRPNRRPGRQAPRVPDRLHLRRLPAAAVPDRVSRAAATRR